ncbi:MAG: hypothetical protein WC332_00450 [Clostridia bacterium]|jgi:hypothetical protein
MNWHEAFEALGTGKKVRKTTWPKYEVLYSSICGEIIVSEDYRDTKDRFYQPLLHDLSGDWETLE